MIEVEELFSPFFRFVDFGELITHNPNTFVTKNVFGFVVHF